jgi:hypothetical protein
MEVLGYYMKTTYVYLFYINCDVTIWNNYVYLFIYYVNYKNN